MVLTFKAAWKSKWTQSEWTFKWTFLSNTLFKVKLIFCFKKKLPLKIRPVTLTGENTKPSSISSSAGSIYSNSSPGKKNIVDYYVLWKTVLSYLPLTHPTVQFYLSSAFLFLCHSTMLTCWSLCFHWITVFSLYYKEIHDLISNNVMSLRISIQARRLLLMKAGQQLCRKQKQEGKKGCHLRMVSKRQNQK